MEKTLWEFTVKSPVTTWKRTTKQDETQLKTTTNTKATAKTQTVQAQSNTKNFHSTHTNKQPRREKWLYFEHALF
jgi:hypothetical protein